MCVCVYRPIKYIHDRINHWSLFFSFFFFFIIGFGGVSFNKRRPLYTMYSLLFFTPLDFCDLFCRGLSLSHPLLWNTGERNIKYLGRGVRKVRVREKTAREGFYAFSRIPSPQWFPACTSVYAKLFRGNGFRNVTLVYIPCPISSFWLFGWSRSNVKYETPFYFFA